MKIFRDRIYGINSEGDLYREDDEGTTWVKEDEHEALPDLIRMWRHFMVRFRNWEECRKGKSSSDTTGLDAEGSEISFACVMPCGYISKKDNRPRAWLQLEYASMDNGKITKEVGVPARALRPLVDAMAEALAAEFPELHIFVYAEWRGYYMLNLCGTEAQKDRLYDAAIRAAEMTRSDETLYRSHEWIG